MAYKRVSDKQFATSKHQYTDPRNGERVTSVTTICEMLDLGGKLRAGAGAAVKLAKEGKNHNDEWKRRADIGTRVHGYAGLWVLGKTADVPAEDGPYMDAFAKFCDDHRPTWLETERPVIGQGYGGRFDGIAELYDDFGERVYALLDFKTGRHWAHPLALQLAGYRFADGMLVYGDDDNASHLEDMPYIQRCAGLYLGDDGEYELHWTQDDEAAFAAFCQLLTVKQWAKTIKQPR